MVFVAASESRLDGAPSAPLAIEPVAGKQSSVVNRAQEYMAAGRLAKQYMDAGMPEEKAWRIAQNQVKMYGAVGAEQLSNENAADPDKVRANAATSMEDDRRHAQMKADYDIATGLGPASPQTQAQWANSEANAREAGRIIRSGLHPQTPVDPGTPEQQASWNQFLEDNPDEMQRYRPQEFAAQQAAQKAESDKAHAAMLEQKYGPGTGAKWLEARAQGQSVGTDVIPAYAPTDQELADRRADSREYTANVSVPRWIREAGLNPDDPKVKLRTPGELRLAAADARAADKQARELQWRAMVMMRAGNFTGALALPGMDEAMRSSILNQQNAALNANRPGGPLNFGPTPLGVEAMHNQQLTELGNRVATGQGFQQMNPAQQAAVNAQVQAQQGQLPAAQQVPLHVKEEAIHPSEYTYADDYVKGLYSSNWGLFGTSSDYTLAEQQQTVDHLVNDLGYAQAKAQKIVDEIARRRHAQSYTGSSTRQAPVQANPTGGAI